MNSQETLDQANAYIKATTGQASALEGKKYDPSFIEALKQSSMKKRSEAQEAYDRARTERERGLMLADQALVEQRKTAAQLNLARAAAADKIGADALIAKPKNISAVTDGLKAKYGDALDSAAARTYARSIALDAERRMRDERKTQAEAVKAAIDFATSQGELSGIQPMRSLKGTSVKNPLPLPPNRTDPSAYKNNMIYAAPDGPRFWDEDYENPDGTKGALLKINHESDE